MYDVNNVADNSLFRPFSTAMSDRDVSVASITLVQATPSTKDGTEAMSSDLYESFLKSFGDENQNYFNAAMGIGTDYSGAVKSTIPHLPKMQESQKQTDKKYYGIFNNFMLTEVSESREELVRIVTNFGGSWNAFFFGENPRVFTFSGVFLDSPEYPYYQEFVTAYDNYLSGRKCLINNMRMTITYDGRVVNGHILKLINAVGFEQQKIKQFTFTVLVEKDYWVRFNSAAKGMLFNYIENQTRYSNVSYNSVAARAKEYEIANALQSGRDQAIKAGVGPIEGITTNFGTQDRKSNIYDTVMPGEGQPPPSQQQPQEPESQKA